MKKSDAFVITDEEVALQTKHSKAPYLSTSVKVLVICGLLFTSLFLLRLERQQHRSALSREIIFDTRPGYMVVQVRRPGYDGAARGWEHEEEEAEGTDETDETIDHEEKEEEKALKKKDEDDETIDGPRASWGEWSRWSQCSRHKFCQEGSQYRKRKCITINKNDHCTGVSMESRDCPAGSCAFHYNRMPLFADLSPATGTSFIGQECNATTKYYGRGKYADVIPEAVYRLFPGARKMMTSGFFALQEVDKVLREEEPFTKVCFEPFGKWSLSAVRKTFRLNRVTKASLKNMRSNNIVGLAIGLKPDGSLYGVLVATGTPGAMYSAVYYRRWRGRSFHDEHLSF
ncbi:uncharacterized protein LOC5508606 [Nematostella vectensis]|uniref:uncharacterized protein LOC5508606 n=1 Tax=Nematostella vectensis TaxID=45351 RepID=UPI0020775E31|nr:uncharacterized protein LOC5508606 [Nematostella vectensis]XP_032233226.2 uncharacterized protein LOC5508606 [Nematostella vectensis]XP_032233227.2 uncharacterized protein LOC5508606 [Nematostella vectensis]XP_048584490.1 uncharacterized protein LOC5508606 [Nematostella vectensis]